jgi:hypothetical protein
VDIALADAARNDLGQLRAEIENSDGLICHSEKRDGLKFKTSIACSALWTTGFFTSTRTNKNQCDWAATKDCIQTTVVYENTIATIIPCLQTKQSQQNHAHDTGQKNA